MLRMPRTRTTVALALTVLLAAAACSSTKKPDSTASSGAPAASSTAGQTKFFNQADFDRQMAQRNVTPEGDPATPWLQMIQPSMVYTAKYAKPGGKWHVCFSNASVSNPWRDTRVPTIN